MNFCRFPLGLFIPVVSMILSVAAWAATEQVLYTITDIAYASPSSTLIFDPAGNLYGVTWGGVIELSASGNTVKAHLLHELPRNAEAGGKLLRDTAGNLYGTAWQGGVNNCGFVYRLSPSSGLPWNYAILHQFTSSEGCGGSYGLISDANGNIYGETSFGGTNDKGSAYELSPNADDTWTFTVLHQFSQEEGGGPQTSLVFDTAGNLFGGNPLAIFELSPNSDGTWTETTAYTFSYNDGNNPFENLIFDSAGNLYGTNQSGGQYQGGTAFMLTANGSGSWTSTVLHSFGQTRNDGYAPYGGLVADASGNLYGTTLAGGGSHSNGTLYELSLGTDGTWTETVLNRFGSHGSSKGAVPEGGLVLDGAGNLYGTTTTGGDASCYPQTAGCGVVYRVLH